MHRTHKTDEIIIVIIIYLATSQTNSKDRVTIVAGKKGSELH